MADSEQVIDRVEWDDVEHAIRRFMYVWYYDGDVRWMKEAWRRLAQIGLNEYDGTGIERTKVFVRLVALGHLYWDFSFLAFEEGTPIEGPINEFIDALGISPLFLGQLVGTDVFAEYGDGEPSPAAACRHLSDDAREEIVRRLLQVFDGPDALFESLCRSPHAVDDTDWDGQDEDCPPWTYGLTQAKEWVDRGCPVCYEMDNS